MFQWKGKTHQEDSRFQQIKNIIWDFKSPNKPEVHY